MGMKIVRERKFGSSHGKRELENELSLIVPEEQGGMGRKEKEPSARPRNNSGLAN
jgi:hypothetical protein